MPWRRGLVNPLAPGRGPTPACTHNCTVLVLTQKESQRAVVGLMHLMTLYSGLVPEQLPERLFPSRLLYYILLLVAQSHCTHPKVGSGIVGSCLVYDAVANRTLFKRYRYSAILHCGSQSNLCDLGIWSGVRATRPVGNISQPPSLPHLL